MPPSLRAALGARLREQLPVIEADVYGDLRSMSAQEGRQDPGYLAGLRAAVAEALEHLIAGVEEGGDASSTPLPLAAIAQARRAARHGVELDTVLRRCAAGDRRLAEFVWAESERFPAGALQKIVREQGARVNRLTAAVSAEYMQEREQLRRSPAALRSQRIRRELASEGPLNLDGLGYPPAGWHLGLIVKGPGAEASVRKLARSLGREALISEEGEEIVLAWLGGRRPLALTEVEAAILSDCPEQVEVALGEPRQGPAGWRLTLHEARAAFAVMLQRPKPLTRGSEVVLLAAMLASPPLAESLLATFVRPWAGHHCGAALCRTLRAYLATDFNAESAARLLRIDRSTVHRHIHKIEDALGRPLRECHAELRVALELRELQGDCGVSDR